MVHETGNRMGSERDLGQWPQVARLWAQVVPPLRPSQEDIDIYQDILRKWTDSRHAPRALLLGVTPEIYGLAWPRDTDLIAVDRSQAMIDSVWPGSRRAAKCGDWLEMKLPKASRNLVFCDGGMNLLAYPDEHRRLVAALTDILSPAAQCILRLFAPPQRYEAPEIVFEELVAGGIPNLSVLKLRLWAALQRNAVEGVALADVWRTVKDAVGDLEKFADKIGWPVEQLLAINAYRDTCARYHLITIDETVALFCANGAFRLGDVQIPGYEYGDRCPIVVLEREPAV